MYLVLVSCHYHLPLWFMKKSLTKHHADNGRCFISKRREFNEKEDFHNHTLLKIIGFKN